jgi:hypothetical protein
LAMMEKVKGWLKTEVTKSVYTIVTFSCLRCFYY